MGFEAAFRCSDRRLQVLDSALGLDDLTRLQSNRFEALSGDRKGQVSIRINMQWRVCFEWLEDGPHNVEITDYH
jgi:proteic killer suppression protein